MMIKTVETQKSARAGSSFGFILLLGICLLFLCLFTGLGIWQVERLGWKTNLIARVNERTHLAPIAAPDRTHWADISAEKDEYLPVKITGHFLNDKEILVTALADNDTGYWLMTPLQSADGALTFINRGFVPMDRHEIGARAAGQIDGETTVTGLLRMSEGAGFFPRRNQPQTNHWYTRELPAMAQKLGLNEVAPYFIDADKTPNMGGVPVGGLTVVSFRNAHLSYAITWFTLAIGTLAATIFVIYNRRRKSRG